MRVGTPPSAVHPWTLANILNVLGVCTWTIEVQCLTQILANRLSLTMYNPQKERLLKVGLLVAIGIINVSVFCIWVPTRLQISQTFIRINNTWDRMEKAIFAVIDMSLNVYFIKSKLVASGLKQYGIVWKYNVFMVFISISLDILVIGLMSLPDDAVYVQAHPPDIPRQAQHRNEHGRNAGQGGQAVDQAEHPSPDVWQPYPGTDRGVFDREWVGSAKDSIMSPGGGAGGSGEGGSAGGGQRHELNMDILNNPNLGANDSGASTSGTQGDGGKRGQS